MGESIYFSTTNLAEKSFNSLIMARINGIFRQIYGVSRGSENMLAQENLGYVGELFVCFSGGGKFHSLR